jgi:hypothetical protein
MFTKHYGGKIGKPKKSEEKFLFGVTYVPTLGQSGGGGCFLSRLFTLKYVISSNTLL